MAKAAEDTIEWVRKSVEWTERQYYATIGEIVVLGVAILVAIMAVGTAFRANRIARESSERQLRAYVYVRGTKFKWKDNQRIEVFIGIKNYGQTPAYNIIDRGDLFIGEPTKHQIEGVPRRRIETDLGPTAEIAFPMLTPTLSAKIWEGIRARTIPIYVYGEVRYCDTFGVPRWTQYCMTLSPFEDRLIHCDEGNKSS